MENIQKKTAVTAILSMKLQNLRWYISHSCSCIFFLIFVIEKKWESSEENVKKLSTIYNAGSHKGRVLYQKNIVIFCKIAAEWYFHGSQYLFPPISSSQAPRTCSEVCHALEEYKHKHEALFTGRLLNSDWESACPCCCKKHPHSPINVWILPSLAEGFKLCADPVLLLW